MALETQRTNLGLDGPIPSTTHANNAPALRIESTLSTVFLTETTKLLHELLDFPHFLRIELPVAVRTSSIPLHDLVQALLTQDVLLALHLREVAEHGFIH